MAEDESLCMIYYLLFYHYYYDYFYFNFHIFDRLPGLTGSGMNVVVRLLYKLLLLPRSIMNLFIYYHYFFYYLNSLPHLLCS